MGWSEVHRCVGGTGSPGAGRLPKAGLRLVATQAHVYAEAGSSSFLLNLAETYVPLAASTGLVPAADVDAWLADQRRSAEDGTFFAACNCYAYVARAAA